MDSLYRLSPDPHISLRGNQQLRLGRYLQDQPGMMAACYLSVMFGTGLFTYSEFLFRMILNLVRRIGTGSWPVIDAIISRSNQSDFILGSGYVIVLHYKYRNADQRFGGTYKKPFIYPNYAKAYLNRFPGGTKFPVRVNPKETSRSIPDNPKVVFIKVI
jgi:hypothetical protein